MYLFVYKLVLAIVKILFTLRYCANLFVALYLNKYFSFRVWQELYIYSLRYLAHTNKKENKIQFHVNFLFLFLKYIQLIYISPRQYLQFITIRAMFAIFYCVRFFFNVYKSAKFIKKWQGNVSL